MAADLGFPAAWCVGDCRILRVIELESVGGTKFILPGVTRQVAQSVPWLVPNFADEQGRLRMAIQLLVVDAPGGQRIAVDTCVGNHKKRELEVWHMRSGPFLEHLATAGVTPESVTHVLCTHLHTDHIGWNTRLVKGKWVPTFPRARYLFGKKEYEYWSQGGVGGTGTADTESLQDSVLPIVEAGLADLVGMDHVLVSDESVRIYLRPTPGHSPGHVSLIVESRGERAIITGDCVHHPVQLARPDLGSSADTDAEEAVRTRTSLLGELAGTRTFVFGTHFPRPTCGCVQRHGAAFMLDTQAAAEAAVPLVVSSGAVQGGDGVDSNAGSAATKSERSAKL